MSRIKIHHYSDILCIWAYISEIRVQELKSKFSNQIEFDFHFFPIFGDVPGKMASSWADRGGLDGYAKHVHATAGQFEHMKVDPGVWVKAQPYSSLPGHLYIAAVKQLERSDKLPIGSYEQLASGLRRAFFQNAADVSNKNVLDNIVSDAGLPLNEVKAIIETGEAYTTFAEDIQLARDQNVRSSPTLIFNDDRQRLSGNVGYRIIEANIKELLEHPAMQHSWC